MYCANATAGDVMNTNSQLDGVIMRVYANGTVDTRKILPVDGTQFGIAASLGATFGLNTDMIPTTVATEVRGKPIE